MSRKKKWEEEQQAMEENEGLETEEMEDEIEDLEEEDPDEVDSEEDEEDCEDDLFSARRQRAYVKKRRRSRGNSALRAVGALLLLGVLALGGWMICRYMDSQDTLQQGEENVQAVVTEETAGEETAGEETVGETTVEEAVNAEVTTEDAAEEAEAAVEETAGMEETAENEGTDEDAVVEEAVETVTEDTTEAEAEENTEVVTEAVAEESAESDVVVSEEAETEAVEEEEVVIAAEAAAEQMPDRVAQMKAAGMEVSGLFGSLVELNPDIIGWLDVSDKISTPVMLRDNEYYTNHDFYGNGHVGGTVFADELDQDWVNAPYLVLYGNDLEDGSLFGGLEWFRDPAYFKENAYVKFQSAYNDDVWEFVPFAVLHVSVDPQNEGFFFLRQFAIFEGETRDEAAIEAFLGEIRERSMYDVSLDVNSGDRILCMVTGGQGQTGERLMVFCRQLRAGEDKESVRTAIWNGTSQKN